MKSTDTDVCVVTETYLKPEMPEMPGALAQIPGNLIDRRKRHQCRNDSRKKVEWQYSFGITSVL